MSNESKIKVIYIGGLEHSGSTLLGVILDNHPEAICVGELSHIPRVGWFGDEICSCDQRISNCQFWTQVRTCWEDTTKKNIKSLADLEFEIDSNRNLPRVALEKYHPSSTFELYSNLTSAMYEVIANISKKPTIVDTSKRASRAYALSMIENIDLRLVHLVRDPRGVAYSSGKPTRKKRRTWYSSAIRWNLINRAFDYVRKAVGDDHSLLIRYEDLMDKPIETLTKIGHFTEIDLVELSEFVAQGGELRTGHIGGGNRFVHSGSSFNLNPDLSWSSMLNGEKQQWIKWITQGGMRHYGY